MSRQAALVLAAGDGKRMKSKEPKVMAEVLFKPMLRWVLDAAAETGIEAGRICVVISPCPGSIPGILPEGVKTVVQQERLGTGHAVMAAADFLRSLDSGHDVLVLCGDAPFVDSDTIRRAYELHKAGSYEATMVTVLLDDPSGYGRVLRKEGVFERIVESADASAGELTIREVNTGVCWFSVEALLDALPRLHNGNAQGEYYLTDVMGLVRSVGLFTACDSRRFLGANDRRQLAHLNALARDMVLERLYREGVDIPITDGVMISPDVRIGAGTRILPGTLIAGATVIGENCLIGPHSRITESIIGSGSIINQSQIERSVLGSGVRVGPFAQLRPGCRIADRAKIGNFVEVKNTVMGEKSSAAHLSYLGDSDIGAGVNIGCGVVTVNYDGERKFRTTVEDGAFIGCNANLIAPVRVCRSAYVAAGTTVTQEVPAESLAIGRAQQVNKPEWIKKRRQRRDANADPNT